MPKFLIKAKAGAKAGYSFGRVFKALAKSSTGAGGAVNKAAKAMNRYNLGRKIAK